MSKPAMHRIPKVRESVPFTVSIPARQVQDAALVDRNESP